MSRSGLARALVAMRAYSLPAHQRDLRAARAEARRVDRSLVATGGLITAGERRSDRRGREALLRRLNRLALRLPALAEGLTLSASYFFGQHACPSWQQAFLSLQHCGTSWAGVVAPHSTATTKAAMTA